jgi:hypothetical protein
MMTSVMGRLGMRGLAGLLAGLVACSSTEPGAGDAPANGTVPAELVGSWIYGSVSPTSYYNPGSGQSEHAHELP